MYFLLVPLVLSGFGYTDSPGQQAQLHDCKAQELLAQKKPELAAEEFAAALALDPRNLDIQANLGVLLFFQKDYAEAEPLLNGVMDQRPDLTRYLACANSIWGGHLSRVLILRQPYRRCKTQMRASMQGWS